MEGAQRSPALLALGALLDGSHFASPNDLPEVVLTAGRELGWQVVFYIVDYGQQILAPMLPTGFAAREPEEVDSTVAGRAFRNTEPTPAGSDQSRLWVPLIDGVDRLGVLCIDGDPGTDFEQPQTLDHVRWFSHLVGHLIATKGAYGDGLHRVRMTRPRTIESELIWSLLPPLTMACHGLVIAGVLEPVHQVAGDVFDYAVDHRVAHLGIFDATGHDLRSGLIGALALSAYRNSRRADLDLVRTAAAIDTVLYDLEPNTLATGVLGQLDITAGHLRYLNAGHPSPLLLRRGKVVKELALGRRIMFGLPGTEVAPAEEQLEPGDWIVMYTDGVIEARDPQRNFFGIDRFVDLLERSAANGQPPPETLRRVTHAVLEHQRGVLQDDATILMIEWAGGGVAQLLAT